MTPKEGRLKMYNWIIGKGVVLKDKERTEIKEIMNEYLKCKLPEAPKSQPKPAIQVKPKVSEWKPYKG